MKCRFFLKILIFSLFLSNQVFGSQFYIQNFSNLSSSSVVLGDLNFSYTFTKDKNSSTEKFEKGMTTIYVSRKSKTSNLWIQQKTKYGVLGLEYKNTNDSWINTKVTFRRYATAYKDKATAPVIPLAPQKCEPSSSEKNQSTLNDVSLNLAKQNFSNLFLEKSCSDKLSPKQYKEFLDATYELFNADITPLEKETAPPSVNCIKPSDANSFIFLDFKNLRDRVTLLNSKSNSPEQVLKDSSIPLPISCDFNGAAEKKCGSFQEGQKSKISVDVSCLKQPNASIITLSREILIHEFSHSISKPNNLSEKQIKEIDKGNCSPADILFISPGETDVSKNTKIAEENGKSSGAKKLAGEVSNPYSSFAERATTPAAQTTNVASNESSSGSTEVSSGSAGSGSASGTSQQRTIASTNNFTNTSGSSPTSNYSVPTLQQQAQFQNVKSYVDTSVASVAKKIAPIVSYVESPAFAQTLPPTSFENGNRGETTTSTSDTSTATKSASANRAAVATSRSSEVAASSSTGSTGGSTASANSANLGSSTSATASRKPAAVNKSASRLSSDPGLDNAYALKVRKKLLSDNAYRTELRSKGVQIEFADGYKFETPGHTVLYTEKNGVLVGGK